MIKKTNKKIDTSTTLLIISRVVTISVKKFNSVTNDNSFGYNGSFLYMNLRFAAIPIINEINVKIAEPIMALPKREARKQKSTNNIRVLMISILVFVSNIIVNILLKLKLKWNNSSIITLIIAVINPIMTNLIKR